MVCFAGAKIKKFEPLAEVITDKVTAEIPSLFDGVIKEIIGSRRGYFICRRNHLYSRIDWRLSKIIMF